MTARVTAGRGWEQLPLELSLEEPVRARAKRRVGKASGGPRAARRRRGRWVAVTRRGMRWAEDVVVVGDLL